MKEIFIDTETGGFNPQVNALASISVKCGSYSKTWFIQPYGKTYEYNAIQVNGLTKELLKTKGQPLEIVYKEITDFFKSNIETDKFGLNIKPKLIGHNLRFDIDFLNEFFRSFGSNLFKYVDYHYIDTMFYAQMFNDLGYTEFNDYKLVNIYKDINGDDVNTSKAHTSDFDVLMTENVLNFFRGFKK